MRIVGDNIILRTVNPSDLDILLKWENDSSVLEFNTVKENITKENLQEFVNGVHDIYMDQQLRLMITLAQSEEPIGTIDLFDFDSQTKTVGVGILIFNASYRGKKHGSETLSMVLRYAKEHLAIEKVYCNIQNYNKRSISFFRSLNFVKVPASAKDPISSKRLDGMNLYYYDCTSY